MDALRFALGHSKVQKSSKLILKKVAATDPKKLARPVQNNQLCEICGAFELAVCRNDERETPIILVL